MGLETVAGRIHATMVAVSAVSSWFAGAPSGAIGSGREAGAEEAVQQDLPQAQQHRLVAAAVGCMGTAATAWSQANTRIRTMAVVRFTCRSLSGRARTPARPGLADYYFSVLPAASSFLRYLAGSFLKSFWQDLQQSLISWPS